MKEKSKIKKKENPWLVHVKKVKAINPKMKFSEVLVEAKKTYKR